MNPFTSSLAVVTGASAGIGAEFARQLARRGHPLLLISRNADRLDALAAELTAAHGVAVRRVSADLADESEIERVMNLLAVEPDLGILVNNAGFGTKGRLHTADLEGQVRMLTLHTMAPMLLSRAVVTGMIERRRGWIINVSSVAAFLYGPGNVNYCATKAYLARFSQGLDSELVGTGVVVQALCPGFTRSEFHDRMGVDKARIPGPLWMQAERVVAISIRCAARGRPVVLIPGLRNKLMTALASIVPARIKRWGAQVTNRVDWAEP